METRSITVYDSIDGKAFWKREECLAHEASIPLKQLYYLKYPNALKGTEQGLYKIQCFSREKYFIPGQEAGFLRAYEEDSWGYGWCEGYFVLVDSTPDKIVDYICSKFPEQVRSEKPPSFFIEKVLKC